MYNAVDTDIYGDKLPVFYSDFSNLPSKGIIERMTLLKRFHRLAAAAAALALTAAMTSCNTDTSWTYRTDDGAYEVTSGMYVGMSISAYNEGYASEGVDSSTPLYDQQIESKEALDWVTTRVDQLCRQYLAIEKKYDEYGLSFDEDRQAYIDSYINYYWSYVSQSYEPQGCAEKSYRQIVTNSFKQSQLFLTLYGEGGEREVPAEELREIFDEQYAHANLIQVDASDDEGNALTGDELDAKLEEAEKMVTELKDGANFETVKTDYAASQKEDSEEEGSSEAAEDEEETDTSFYMLADNTYYPEGLTTAIFAADAGSYGKYNDGEGTIYVWAKLANDDEGFETYRDTILQNEKWEEYETLIQDWTNGTSIVTNDPAIKKHSPKNLEK